MATSSRVHPVSSVVVNDKSHDTPSATRRLAYGNNEEIEDEMEDFATSEAHEAEILTSAQPASRELLSKHFVLAFMTFVLLVSVTAIVLTVLVMLRQQGEKSSDANGTGRENRPESDLHARIKTLEEHMTTLQASLVERTNELKSVRFSLEDFEVKYSGLLVKINSSVMLLQNEGDALTKTLIGVNSTLNTKIKRSINGSKGNQGIQGPQGLQGPQGTKGVKGVTGSPGRNGTDGVDGQKGDVGAQGLQGFNGSKGDQGIEGPRGPQGVKGATGIPVKNGTDGVDGQKGDVGAQGLQGFNGSKGDQGIEGPRGPQGVKGATGSPGRNGTDGVDGQKGDVGAQGLQGFNGSKGDQGIQGPQGPQGEKGATGSPGRNGTNGVDGQKGDIGAQGLQGFNGSKGLQGPQGSAGPRGPQGAGNFSECAYQTVVQTTSLAGFTSATATITEPDGKKILGATCSTNRAAEYNLEIVKIPSGAPDAGKYFYRCTCKGLSTLFTTGSNMQCILHYWECPLTT